MTTCVAKGCEQDGRWEYHHHRDSIWRTYCFTHLMMFFPLNWAEQKAKNVAEGGPANDQHWAQWAKSKGITRARTR